MSAVRTLVRAKKIPSRRLGQEYRIHREALLAWLREGDRA
ncbi:MAG: helix-turn-helix domain-containing protein [Acidobacteria bacterium]|nr:helix-turn-helix domain-containing protein [Acidobacteriota bacterium]